MRFRFLTAFLVILSLFPQTAASRKIPELGELALAVSQGDFSRIDELLLLGADPDQRDSWGQTPLLYAVNSGQYKLLQRILQTTANPDLIGPNGLSPLMTAVKLGREDLVLLLLESGANANLVHDGVSALSLAVDRGEFVIAHRLTDAGADGLFLGELESGNPLGLPVCSVPLDGRIWRGLARLKDNADSPDWGADQWGLHRAVRDGDWFLAAKFLNGGADPNRIDSRGVTPLMTAAWHGDQSLVSLLLERGAVARYADIYGVDAVSYAAAGGHVTIVDQLLTEALKSNPSRFERGPETAIALETSPYYWAVTSGRPDILERLIDFRLPLPAEGEEGVTLLMAAAWLSDTFAVRKLIPLADDAGARDEGGRTALAWSAAAFVRDRQTGLENGQKSRGSRNYPAARMLARRTKGPQEYRSIVSPDISPELIEAWSPGGHASMAEQWEDKRPSPAPRVPGDGDLTLYRIFRDEEQDGNAF